MRPDAVCLQARRNAPEGFTGEGRYSCGSPVPVGELDEGVVFDAVVRKRPPQQGAEAVTAGPLVASLDGLKLIQVHRTSMGLGGGLVLRCSYAGISPSFSASGVRPKSG
jgi:hypothetical protein